MSSLPEGIERLTTEDTVDTEGRGGRDQFREILRTLLLLRILLLFSVLLCVLGVLCGESGID